MEYSPERTEKMKRPAIFGIVGRAIKAIRRDQRGNVGIIFGIGVIPLITFIGVAADYASSVKEQSGLQNALDAAVLAAAPYPSANRTAVGQAYLSAQLPNGLTLTSSSFITNADNSVTGTAQGTVKTAFMSLVNIKTVNVGATAKAGYGASANDVCLLVKDPSASSALLMNSGVTINAPKCEIDVASKGSPAAMLNAPSLDITTLCVAGTSVTQNGGANALVKPGCTTATDPFAGALPAVTVGSCTVSNVNYSGTASLSPGTYCGNFNFNGSGTLNLAAGLYVFTGTHWNLNSGWTVNGTGVTFYFADSNSYIQVNSGVAINISAPTTGTYANILMYEPTGLSTSSFSVDGAGGHSFSGLIYLPSRNVTFNSMSSVASESITMVFNQIIFDTANWSFAPGAKVITNSSSGGSGASTSAYLEN
jgi:Flp pilus assembly protein TadG